MNAAAMSDVDRLLAEYIAEHRAGGDASPSSYLEQVEGADREELRALLDAYLQRAPASAWDPAAFRGSAEERMAESIHRSFVGRSGLWPVVLPRLRERAKVKRADVVEQLADVLGAAGKREKVGAYYHEMEQGSLESDRVSGTVLEALAGIIGSSAERLRKLGQAAGGAAGEAGVEPAFTRVASGQASPGDAEADAAPAAPVARSAEAEEWDEVDELFRGGG